MKHQDVMAQIFSEVTNKPVSYWADVLNGFKKAAPEARTGLEKELTQEEAETLLAQLRQEKAGILNWLIQGNIAARQKIASRLN